jgi:hypothetical protein
MVKATTLFTAFTPLLMIQSLNEISSSSCIADALLSIWRGGVSGRLLAVQFTGGILATAPPLQAQNEDDGTSHRRVGAGDAGSDWSYVIHTGRVWKEAGDGGLSRAAIPFALVRDGSECTRNGVVTFVFNKSGNISFAAVQLDGGTCAETELCLLEAVYTPASLDDQARAIESVMRCAADAWLPLVQGSGGITLTLTPDDQLHYVMRDAGEDIWLNAGTESAAVTSLCE